MRKTSLIIPTRNECESIGKLLEQILPYGYEVVIVDDSDDDTPIIAKKMGAKIIKGRRLGLAQAVLDGIDATESDNIIIMDGDGQHPFSILPDVVEQLKYHDLVVVSKHTAGSMDELSWWRRLQSNLAVWSTKFIVPAPVSDPMSGFFGIRRKCLEGIPRGEYEKDGAKMIGLEAIGFKIGLEFFAKARWVSHAEIPMVFAKREEGMSKGTRNSLQKHLVRLYKNSLNYEVELPKGCEEYFAFYEGTEWQKQWKQGIAEILKKITEELNVHTLLDIGCGSSPNINYMRAVQKYGMDINREALEYMREHSDSFFGYGSVLNIPAPSDSYDVVACIEVLEHLHSHEVDTAMAEITRVLSPGGHAILATPNYSSKLWNLVENAQKLFQKGAWTSDHYTKFNRKTLGELCNKYGMHELFYDSVMNNMDMVITYRKH